MARIAPFQAKAIKGERKMDHQEGYLRGVRDANIYYQRWLPEGEPKSILLLVHGLAEHSGRYMNVVNHFCPLGYAVYSLDHLGHGRSDGTRVYVERFEDFTEPLQIYFDMVRGWQPNKPIFIVGHSMGGLIGAAYLLDHQAELAGAVLSAPCVKGSDDTSSTTILISKVLSTLLPRFGVMQVEAAGVSRDPAVVQAYVDDPLVYTGKIPARMAAELLKTMQRVTAEAPRITLPILLVQGSQDRLVDPRGARMLYDTVGSVDKTIQIYDGLYHEVFNEPEHTQVLSDVEAWLDARLGSQ
jgi:acylglycerol lipase